MMPKLVLKYLNLLMFTLTSIALLIGMWVLFFLLNAGLKSQFPISDYKVLEHLILRIIPGICTAILIYWFSMKFSVRYLYLGILTSFAFILFGDIMTIALLESFGYEIGAYDKSFNFLNAIIAILSFMAGIYAAFKVLHESLNVRFNWFMIVVANISLISFLKLYISLYFLGFSMGNESLMQFIGNRLTQLTIPYFITALFIIWLNHKIVSNLHKVKVSVIVLLIAYLFDLALRYMSNANFSIQSFFGRDNLSFLGFTVFGLILGYMIGLVLSKYKREQGELV